MFQSALDLTGEVQITILRGEGEFIARVPFGFDDTEGRVYSVFVALAPMAGYADIQGYELVFNVLEAGTDGGEILAHWDGHATRNLLADGGLRRQVLDLICLCVRHLIDEAQPPLVHMVTHSAGLPSKALLKFGEICNVFRQREYEAGKADIYHGRHIWMMERA